MSNVQEEPHEEALLNMHARGGLREHDALGAADRRIGHFLTTPCRESVHEDGVGGNWV
jgi:hypothetical protein